jgi:hypothetical protein
VLHDPPINVPFLDVQSGIVARPWVDWLIINKRDKANRVEGSTEGHILTADIDGHPQDSGSTMSSVIVDIAALQAADILIQADVTDLQAADVLIEADIVSLEAADVTIIATALADAANSFYFASL